MKKQTRGGRTTHVPPPPKHIRGIRPAAIVVAVLLAVSAGWALGKYWNAQPPAKEPASTVRPQPVVAVEVDFQKLKGRWQRSDGGYVLEIRSVNADGTLDAAYLNPRPINVAKAVASREGASLKVFIELRDKNYPGSTYQLVYEPQADQLSGVYFQAVERQQFEVAFARMK